jgi:signal recognition particle subunit SRP54
MFDSLAHRLQEALSDVRSHGTLTEQDVDSATRQIRLALLEADVNFKVVKQFTDELRERCLGAGVIGGLNPGQQVVKIVGDELTALMGGTGAELSFSASPPTVIVMAGLQGSGKTTATAKLARYLREERSSSVALAACDIYRPAAVEQLIKLGDQAQVEVYARGAGGAEPAGGREQASNPVEIAEWALARATREGKDVLIVDTSGRMHVDEQLMAELGRIRNAVRPLDVLLVVDAMTGQDAVKVAERFAEEVDFTGVVMSKLDGDARGGAALSIVAATERPILFASTGEKLEQFERFHPDRMAQRILGMGDVMSLIEKAEREVDQSEAIELERKLRAGELGLDDLLDQLRMIRRMGPLTSLIGMIPGLGGRGDIGELSNIQADEHELDRAQAIILSMTPQERRRPELIKGSRRLRIARGSGASVQQVNRLLKQFDQMRKLMRTLGRGKSPDIGALLRQAR